jgi:hypothetical protein
MELAHDSHPLKEPQDLLPPMYAPPCPSSPPPYGPNTYNEILRLLSVRQWEEEEWRKVAVYEIMGPVMCIVL